MSQEYLEKLFKVVDKETIKIRRNRREAVFNLPLTEQHILLTHALSCSGCNRANCSDMKHNWQRASKCNRPARSGCVQCIWQRELFQLHNEKCAVIGCRVRNCKNWKRTLTMPAMEQHESEEGQYGEEQEEFVDR